MLIVNNLRPRRNPAAEMLGYDVEKGIITFTPPVSYNKYEYYDVLGGVIDTTEENKKTVTVFVLKKKNK